MFYVQTMLWNDFKAKYGKTYSGDTEESSKRAVFLDNLRLADARNEKERLLNNTVSVHGITKFFDLTPEGFGSRYLNPTVMTARQQLIDAGANGETRGTAVIPHDPKATLGLVDWSTTLTTPVRDQGYCGSCWAMSVAEQLESDAMRMLGKSYVLSPEQIIQCDTSSQGCNGGLTENAFAYVQKAGGIEQDKDYPYSSTQGVTGKCQVKSDLFVVGVSSYTTLKGEGSMASYVQTTGPLSICVDSTVWTTYSSGILSMCGQSVNHCVQAVGVDASSDGYWKVRNSWGTNWGENGYIRLAYGKNTCGLSFDPIYASVFSV
jgi:C1A family cysteine protease